MVGNREYIKGQEQVKRLLRQEVAFGCPMPGCRKPFLTYHHFDPPWKVKHHWDPDGIIALCLDHHQEADHYTKDRLRKLKQASYSVDDVKGQFPQWEGQFLVRCGGIYVAGSKSVLQMGGEDIIVLESGVENLLFLSFYLESQDGETVAVMQDNVFDLGPAEPYDVKMTNNKTEIEVWFAERDIGLDVVISRLTDEELNELLETDRGRAKATFAAVEARVMQDLEKRLAGLPLNIANYVRTTYDEMKQNRSPRQIAAKVSEFRQRFGETRVPDRILAAHFSGDPVGYRVRDWAHTHCVDSDGRIQLLNFRNLSIYRNGRHVRIRNGIGKVAYYSALFDNETAISL